MNKKWWMEAVGYQIYPKSFFDTNADGIGDLNGIYEKLDYLHELGVNLLWICPFYDSPMDDNGYDVRDYFSVHKDFGDISDFKRLMTKANRLGIKIILDFVLNHTSDEHKWFMESKKSKDNPYRDYYIWHDGKMINGQKQPPTNWGSFFGGSCWQYSPETDSYYMKIFSNKMPDLNWNNHAVLKEMVEVGKWWLDLGVSGFRIDAVSHLERAEFIDSTPNNQIVLDWFKFSNLPGVHKHLKSLNQALFSPKDILTIGEVGGEASIEQGLKYAGFKENELSMVFSFDHNWCNNLWDISKDEPLKTNVQCLINAFNSWQVAFKDKGWLPLNWLNHDQPRLASHYGSKRYLLESTKMLATLIHMLRGTPFIYQGEEIGMTNYPFESIDEFADISSINKYNMLKTEGKLSEEQIIESVCKSTRDHGRTPFQWDDTEYAGFTTKKPWIKINPNYKMINLSKNLENKDSLWYHYQRLISLRRHSVYHEVITYGSYHLINQANQNLFCYERQNQTHHLLVINSFSEQIEHLDIQSYKIIKTVISNYKKNKKINGVIQLEPYESIVLEVKKL